MGEAVMGLGLPVTDEQLAEWERAEQAATPGPWSAATDDDAPITAPTPPKITRKGNGLPKEVPQPPRPVVSLDNHAACGDPECCPDSPYVNVTPADRAFIALARAALHALIAEVRRLRALPALRTWTREEVLDAVRICCGEHDAIQVASILDARPLRDAGGGGR